MLVDTHCHLDQFDDPAAVLRLARERGVGRVVALSESAESMRAVLALKEAHPQWVLAGLGLHPVWITRHARAEIDPALEWLAAHLEKAEVLGEVGLDHKWAVAPEQQALQEEILHTQLELAAACSKPLNLHARRCLRPVMECAIAFRRRTGLNAQLHWFTHSKKLVRICNEEGLYISVGPSVLCDAHTQEVVRCIADPLLLLETDAPVPIAGQPGHPARARQVAEKLAEIKGCSWKEIAALSSENFARYLEGGRRPCPAFSPQAALEKGAGRP